MEPLLLNVNWLAIVIGAVVAFALGSLWYSPAMFGTQWMKGVGITEKNKGPMGPAMFTQAVGTFLLSWVIGITAASNSLHAAILVALTIAVIIKANGLWANKGTAAIIIESTYVLAMVLLMILVHMFV